MKKKLESVTLLGIDCVDFERLAQAADICEKDFEFAQVKLLTSLQTSDSRAVRIPSIDSTEAYSRFVIEKLDDYVETPHVLIVQYDGFILNPAAWSDTFLDYDYIGAPWLVQERSFKFGFPKEWIGQLVVGNGGFSIRSKAFVRTCAELAQENQFARYHPEDVVVCVDSRELLEERGMRFAPPDVAKQFSFEALNDEDYSWDGQFGFHGLHWTDISRWLTKHPEYSIDNTLYNNGKKHGVTQTFKK